MLSSVKLKKLKTTADNGDSNNNKNYAKRHKKKDIEMSADGGGGGSSTSGASANRPQDQQLGKDGRTAQPALHLSSDEVNYLIYRYMQESGFVHSSFTFAYESMLGRSNMSAAVKSIPPGALISFLQKGLQYVGIEETLHREQQQQQKGNNNNSNNNKRKAEGSVDDVAFNLSLLSPVTINAMTREKPPLQLNVPPAAAAAAVRARLEAEAVIEENRKKVAIKEAQEKQQSSNGKSARLTGPQSIPPQTNIPLTNPLANAAPGPMSVQAAMSQLQQQQHHQHYQQQQQAAQSQQQKDPAALLAQQRIDFVLEEQRRQQQLQMQLEQEKQLLHLSARNQSIETLNMSAAAQQQAQGAAILASVAEQMGNNMNKSNGGASGKKPTSAKKGPKNKGKSKQQQQRAAQPAAPQNEATTNPAIAMSNAAAPSLPQASGLAALGELAAVAERSVPPQRDVVMSDAGEEADNHRPHHRHLQRLAAAQHPQANNTLYQMQQAAVQELMSMNGKAPRNFTNSSAAEPPQPNGALSAQQQSMQAAAQQQQQQQAQPPAKGAQTPKEAAKAVDAIIDREDEITNAKVSEVLELKLHSSEVFMCAWNSVFTDMIATGSGDASARIWQMGGPKAGEGLGPVKLLPHGQGPADKKNKDVTTLEWSSDGKLLATGSYDGVARVWSLDGALVHTLRGHKGPIFSLKWNKTGNYLLSGSYDKTTIVWDVSSGTGFIKQQFDDHQAPALDVDWKDDATFASCSTDKTVHICRVGEEQPLKIYTGHTDEVNAVKWDPSGTLLASCSDDCTAKVWDVTSDRKDPMYDFKSHQQEIYTVKWAPTGPGSKNPDKKPLLATASFDGSVRLWNIKNGTCIQVFSRHRDSVYSVAFSPSGNYLASGSLAGQLYIWNVQEGRHIKSFKGKGDIFEVAWNKEETRVAACFSSNVVCILDFP